MSKKLFTLLILLLAGAASFAQPILTASNTNPVPGDAFIIINSTGTGVSPGGSGASVTWDFSSLDTTSIDTGIATACALLSPTCGTSGLYVGASLGIVTESQ